MAESYPLWCAEPRRVSRRPVRGFAGVPEGYAFPAQALDQPVFGGVVKLRDRSITLEHYRDRWWINAGTVHGIQPPSNGDTTVLAVLQPENGTATVSRTALGRVRVTVTEPARCQVAVVTAATDVWQPDPETRYATIVVDVPIPSATVELRGEAAGVDLVRAALAGSPHLRDGAPDPGLEGDRFIVMAERDELPASGRAASAGS